MNRIFILFFSIFFSSLIAISQWSTDPYNNLIVGYGLFPELCSDSAGGCYITYEQGLSFPRHLILERLNRYGTKPWGSGKRITGGFEGQSDAKIVEDGQNGVIVSYRDVTEAVGRVKIQRVDSSGNFLWGANGVRVSLSETNQYYQVVVSDGEAGCIVAWVDTLGGLRINRINAEGIRVWGDSGIYVWNSPERPMMVNDGSHGCIIVFGASRIQRFGPNGTGLWGSSGVQHTELGISSIQGDNNCGLIIAGMKYLSYNNGDPLWRATCQKIDSSGNILWGSSGFILDDSIQNIVLNPPAMALTLNTEGGVTFAWNARTSNNKLRTFTQRIKSNGDFVFQDGARRVSTADSLGNGPWAIVTSSGDSKIIVNADGRFDGSIYAQCMDSLGTRLWNDTDNVISIRELSYVKVISDMRGGFILIGFNQPDFSIRVQQCSRNGILSEIITGIEDKLDQNTPTEFSLYQNYPNPFNSSTLIKYDVHRGSHVKLEIYNLLGQKLFTLVDQFQQPGTYQINFGSSNLSSGVYLFKLQTDQVIQVTKLTILK